MSLQTSLFGSSGRTSSKNLLEFRAGKMFMKGAMVHADKRKGNVYIYQSDDSLMHFCWKERKSSSAEDDLIIFPDDTEYKKVPQCATGRVCVLKFKSSSRKLFFWMQESKTDKDDHYLQKVNDLLNNPPTPGSSRAGGSTPGGVPSELSNLGDGDLQNLLNSMNQQQLMQLFGGGMGGLAGLLGRGSSSSRSSNNSTTSASTTTTAATPSSVSTTSTAPTTTTTAATTITTSSASAAGPVFSPTSSTTAPPTSSSTNSGAIQLSDLQNILSGLSVPTGEAASTGPNVDLSSAVTAETLQPILSNPDFISRLQQFLPQIGNTDTLPTVDQLKGTLQSPQFQQAMSLFSAALQSGQLGPLIQQFGLGSGAVDAASQGNMEAFVDALQTKKKEGDKKEDDDDMALD